MIFFILMMMVCSTGYWLYQIDLQEQIVSMYSIQKNSASSYKGSSWFDNLMENSGVNKNSDYGKSDDHAIEITYEESVIANQKIKASYRYMTATDALLLISLITIYKLVK